MVSFTTAGLLTLVLVFSSPCPQLSASSAAEDDLPHAVRVVDPALAETLHQASLRSATLRALVDELGRSNVIVHIVRMWPPLDQLGGSLVFVHGASGRRILRISVNPRLAPSQTIYLLVGLAMRGQVPNLSSRGCPGICVITNGL
jgi:hypothetical protein